MMWESIQISSRKTLTLDFVGLLIWYFAEEVRIKGVEIRGFRKREKEI